MLAVRFKKSAMIMKELSSDGPAGIPAVKVWTRLSNGFLGWRRRKVGLRRLQKNPKKMMASSNLSLENKTIIKIFQIKGVI